MKPTSEIKVWCRLCNQPSTFEVPADAFAQWTTGTGPHVQELFPDLTAAQREMFISRTCADCWDRLFPPDPDELTGEPLEHEFGPQVEYSNLPGGVKAIALNAGDQFRGCRWYCQDGPDRVYLAFRGDPSEFVGSIKAPRVD